MRRTSSTLIIIVLTLLALGIVILASTSSVRGEVRFDDAHYFLKRQLVWLAVSLVVATLLARFDYHWLQRLALPLAVLSVVFLALVLIPGVGVRVGGSRRWVRLGPLSVQPSEFAKVAVVIVIAAWLAMVGRRSARFREGLLYPVAWLGTIAGLMFLEPDFGTTLLTGTVGMLMLFVGGTAIRYLLVTAALGGAGFVVAVLQDPVRWKRILAFLNPEEHRDAAHQLIQSTWAFVSGGLFGVGLGNSMQKQYYLPEAHTDFIFAIVGEELGLVATLLVLVLYAGFLVCGILISLRAPDPFGKLLAFGLTMMISLQAVINVGVVTGCLPTKGLPLPFMSYGGSSLLVCVSSVAILLNIAHHCRRRHEDRHTRTIRDRAHRI